MWRGSGARLGKDVGIGIDLGGTRLRVGVVDADGHLVHSTIIPSSTGLSPTANLGLLTTLIETVLAQAGAGRRALQGIGIGATGPVDVRTGRINNPHTLPGWSDLDLCGSLAAHFGVPVQIENDAAVMALGEYWRGAGVASARMVLVAVGTGIGAALVADGHLYRGAAGFHPEIGHHIIDARGPRCYCGATGCWEQLVAGPSIARLWAATCRARGEADVSQERAGDLFAAAREGDSDAQRLVHRVAYHLGQGLINIIAFCAPDVLVLGGGVMRHFDLLEPGTRAALAAVAQYQPIDRVQLQRSQLGDHAGILGAVYLMRRAAENQANG